MNVSEKQNKTANLKLLVAQATLYRRAKTLQCLRTIGSIGLASISPFVLLLFPSMKSIMASVGGIWLLVSKLIIEVIEKKYSRDAAIIQEEFDTNIFEIPWNKFVVGNKIDPEIIATLNRKSKLDHSNFSNWYPDTGNIPYPGNVFFCQRTNLVWDWRLRKEFSNLIVGTTLLIFSVGIIIALITKQTLLDYLLAILLPSLSALLKGVEISRKHREIAQKKEQISKIALNLLKEFQKNQIIITENTCRLFQDVIFIQRYGCPIIPDWWYRKFKNDFQSDTIKALEYLTLNH